MPIDAIEKDLTATWNEYPDPDSTLAFKLFWNDKPSEQWMKTIESRIPVDSTLWRFSLDVNPGDTLWFAMQSVVDYQDTSYFSELTPWVPWVFLVPAPKPPVPPEGLKITVTFELLEP